MTPVNLIIGGVQKGGTTTLFEHLRFHPDITFGDTKELHVASDRDRFADPDYDLAEAYAAHFAGEPRAATARYVADATPVYCYWPNAVERLAAYNPAIKLILIYRDPIERAFSHWQMEYARGNDAMSFPQAIRSGRARVASDPTAPGYHRVFSYVERGFYSAQLRRVFASFPRAQVLVLENRMLRDDLDATMARIWRFLDVEPPQEPVRPIRANSAPVFDYGYSFQPRDGELLYRLFEWDIEAFAELSGLDVSHWGARYRACARIASAEILREPQVEPEVAFSSNRMQAAPAGAMLHEPATPFLHDAPVREEANELARLRLEVAHLHEKLRLAREEMDLRDAAGSKGGGSPGTSDRGLIARLGLRRS